MKLKLTKAPNKNSLLFAAPLNLCVASTRSCNCLQAYCVNPEVENFEAPELLKHKNMTLMLGQKSNGNGNQTLIVRAYIIITAIKSASMLS